MKRTLSLILATLMVLAVFAGCSVSTEEPEATPEAPAAETPAAQTPADDGGEEPAAPSVEAEIQSVLNGKTIGCTIVYKGDEWCAALAYEIEALAAKYGCEILVEDGDLNSETQTKQIENMVSRNVDLIFADPATPDGCVPALQQAKANDIPIFVYDGYVEEEGLAVTSITWDQPLTGELMANYLIDYVNENMGGEARGVCLTMAASSHCLEREARFKEVLAEKAPGIEIINTQDCEGNRERGANAITNIVEPFDFVASVVDNGAWGSISALEARGADDVKVLSMGAYGAEPFDALKENHPNYLACVVVPPAEIAKGLFESAEKYFNGEEVEEITHINLAVADATNVDDFWDF